MLEATPMRADARGRRASSRGAARRRSRRSPSTPSWRAVAPAMLPGRARGGARPSASRVQPLRAQHHHLLRDAGADDERSGARTTLGIECGYSCLGHNGRANATIGRALRLVMRNVGGSIPGAVSKSVFGQPGRVSLCFGEWEERSPWEPFHVRRGFAPRESVVTAACATGTQDIADIWAETGEELVWVLAHSIDWIGNNKVLVPQEKGDMLLLLCPDFAAQDRARRPLGRRRAAHAARRDAHADRALAPQPLAEARAARLRRERRRCRSRARPEQFLIAVAGGESGHHALYFCTFGLTWSVSRAVRPGRGARRGRGLRAAVPGLRRSACDRLDMVRR